MTVLLLHFQLGFLLFFSSLTSMARTSQVMLNKSGKRGHPGLIPHLRENSFSFLLLTIMFAIGLFYFLVG